MPQQESYQGPLAELNVIDSGHYYAGPMVAMLLADQGANVIRIVRPGENELIRLNVSHEYLAELGGEGNYFFEPEAQKLRRD